MLKKVVKNKQTFRWRIWKLKENNMKTRFQERPKQLVDVDTPNLWNTFKDRILSAGNEACGKKKAKRNHGDSR